MLKKNKLTIEQKVGIGVGATTIAVRGAMSSYGVSTIRKGETFVGLLLITSGNSLISTGIDTVSIYSGRKHVEEKIKD